MSASLAEPMIEAELWVSLQSLLRAYAAAAEAHGGSAARAEAAEGALTLTAGGATLKVECDPVSGAGTWTLWRGGAEAMRGAFRLLDHGRLEHDGNEMDLDHAAIDWVAELTRAGRGQ
jgi:hypothetical protein